MLAMVLTRSPRKLPALSSASCGVSVQTFEVGEDEGTEALDADRNQPEFRGTQQTPQGLKTESFCRLWFLLKQSGRAHFALSRR